MKIRILITTLLCALIYIEAQGRDVFYYPDQTAETDTVATDSIAIISDTTQNVFDKLIGVAEWVLDLVTYDSPSSRYSFAVYPAASYGHRTGLEVGLMPIIQSKQIGRQSSVVMGLLVSTKKMWEVQADMELYPTSNMSMIGKIEWMRLPDEFYLPGNGKKEVAAEMMTRTLCANPTMLIRVGESNWEMGPALRYYYASYKDIEARNEIYQQSVENMLKESGCTSLGIGFRIRRDTRDSNDWPTTGGMIDCEVDFWNNTDRGGACDFTTITTDFRKYIPIKKTVLAGQAYISTTSSKSTPLHLMPTFGGTRLNRAVNHNLKYYDKVAWFTQIEWRTPLFWRLGATVFTGVGNATSEVKDALKDVHGAVGAGLRFKVFPKSGMNIRLDYGMGTHGDHAFYLNVKECF